MTLVAPMPKPARKSLATLNDAPRPNTTTLLAIEQYDLIIVSFSGGKDSLALVLRLLKMGVPKHKIQLWHQSIDGKPRFLGGEAVAPQFEMDWPITESYCRAVAEHLGIKILFSWKEGGFAKEMMRDMSRTAPTSYQCQDGKIRTSGGTGGKEATRKMFPQTSADLSVRWCSAYLKIDVAAMAIAGDPALKGGVKVLYLSGERRQESASRSRYAEFEEHRSSQGKTPRIKFDELGNVIPVKPSKRKPSNKPKRRVDHWRAVIDYSEREVWALIREFGINPHPAYWLGYGRVSCMDCIFMDCHQAATNRYMAALRFRNLCRFEGLTGKTIKRGKSLEQLANEGTIHREAIENPALVALAMGHHYPVELISLPFEQWTTPPGAYKESGGPI